VTASESQSADDAVQAAEAAEAAGPSRPTRMLPNEQQAGYVLAAATAVFTLISHLPAAFRGDGQAAALAALGVGLAVLLAGAVRYGHRVVTSFVAVIAGFAPIAKTYVGGSFATLLYAGWLMWRTSRAQAKAAAAGIRPVRRAPGSRGGRRRKAGPPPTTSGPGRPSPNRRYTPPKSKATSRRGR
jgi:hypothetical protein